MLTASVFEVDSIVNFDLYPSAIIGSGFRNAKINAILDGATAMSFGFDVAQVHASVYPTLPSGTYNDYRGYQYIIITDSSGQKKAIGIPWIVDSSYSVVGNQTMTIIIQNVSADDQIKINRALSSNGYTAYSVSLSTT